MRGGDKLLEPVEGVPVLRLLCQRGLAAELSVRVCVPALDHVRAQALADLPVERIAVPLWRTGMSASVRAGLRALDAPSVLILPADMPEITEGDLRVIARHPGRIVQATAEDGTPGHPVRFDRAYFEELRALTGDTGGRAVLQAHPAEVQRVTLPACHATTDLDTPEAWADWRARTSK